MTVVSRATLVRLVNLGRVDYATALALQQQEQRRQWPAQQQPDNVLFEVTRALDVLLQQHVVPLVPVLLEQEEPMPLYALKVSACDMIGSSGTL